MEPFTTLTAVAVPIDLPNVDTDRIIPARFLRQPRPGPGYEHYLFHDVRFDDEGRERPEFVLNQAPYRGAADPRGRRELRLRILARGRRVGAGGQRLPRVRRARASATSSARTAPRTACSPSCCRPTTCAELRRAAPRTARRHLDRRPSGADAHGPRRDAPSPSRSTRSARSACSRGQDEIALTLSYEPAIAAYEARRAAQWPWRVGHASGPPRR